MSGEEDNVAADVCGLRGNVAADVSCLCDWPALADLDGRAIGL